MTAKRSLIPMLARVDEAIAQATAEATAEASASDSVKHPLKPLLRPRANPDPTRPDPTPTRPVPPRSLSPATMTSTNPSPSEPPSRARGARTHARGPGTVGYPIVVRSRALELRKAGWTIEKIGDLLQREHGVRPSYSTIINWVDPRQAENKRRRDLVRLSRNSTGRVGGHRTPVAKFARLTALRGAGLGYEATAKVLSLDFGDDITAGQVRYAERTGHYPKRLT